MTELITNYWDLLPREIQDIIQWEAAKMVAKDKQNLFHRVHKTIRMEADEENHNDCYSIACLRSFRLLRAQELSWRQHFPNNHHDRFRREQKYFDEIDTELLEFYGGDMEGFNCEYYEDNALVSLKVLETLAPLVTLPNTYHGNWVHRFIRRDTKTEVAQDPSEDLYEF